MIKLRQSVIRNDVLIISILAALCVMFYLGTLMGKQRNDLQNHELKQNVKTQAQAIQALQDSLTILKLQSSKKDTLISLQDPVFEKK